MRMIRTIILLFCLLAPTATAASDSPILGVQDFGKGPRLLALEFAGLAEYLTAQIGQPVRVEAAQSYKRYMSHAQKSAMPSSMAPRRWPSKRTS